MPDDASARPIDLLGYGVAAVDEMIVLDTYPDPDVKVDVRARETLAGGICVNALAAAARLGLRCHYAGALGPNPLSDIVRRGMDDEGITFEPPYVVESAGPSHAFILVDAATGSRTILMDKSRVIDLPADGLSPDLLRRTRALYVDAWQMAAGLPAVQAARDLGVITIADFEEYDPDLVRRFLPHIDHLILPHQYAQKLTGADDAVDCLRALCDAPRACTAVTIGDAGCWYVVNDETDPRHQAAFPAEIIDTTGCGDAFHGAYIAAILDGLPVPDAIRFAAAAAALSARALGAQAGLPTRPEVESFLVASGHQIAGGRA